MVNFRGLPPLCIGDLKTLPIVQGGMGVGVSLASLASAVANMGALGVLSAIGLGFMTTGYAKDPTETCASALRDMIRKARAMTDGVLGINVMVASTNFRKEVELAAEEGIDILFAGAGLPMDMPSFLPEGAKTKLAPIVSSARAARLLIRRWTERYNHPPDAIVVEGPMAGGHLGFSEAEINDPAFALENLVPQVVEEARATEETLGHSIPVIAAGGIYTGEDIAKFLGLGASGVQMGTRFVATDECDAAQEFKEAYVACTEQDIAIIKSPVGMPGRAIVGSFLEQVKEGIRRPRSCAFQCIKTCDPEQSPYCIALALLQAQRGRMDEGFAFAGQNAHRVDRIVSVRALIEELCEGYRLATGGEA